MSCTQLFIPRVSVNITKQDMAHVFLKQKLAAIADIQFEYKTDEYGRKYKTAAIQLHGWFDNVAAQNLKRRIRTKFGRIVYQEPNQWTILKIPTRPKTKQAGSFAPTNPRLSLIHPDEIAYEEDVDDLKTPNMSQPTR